MAWEAHIFLKGLKGLYFDNGLNRYQLPGY